MTDTDPGPEPRRLKDNLLDLARNVDWSRSMARIVLSAFVVLLLGLVFFMWASVAILGDELGGRVVVAVIEMLPGVEVAPQP